MASSLLSVHSMCVISTELNTKFVTFKKMFNNKDISMLLLLAISFILFERETFRKEEFKSMNQSE